MSTTKTSNNEIKENVKEELKDEKKASSYLKIKESIKDLTQKEEIELEDLLRAGVHFGHQKSKWNPKMRRFILTTRNGVRIIDLEQTAIKLKEATDFLKEKANNGEVLIVGTKRQAKDIVKEVAEHIEMPYVIERWLGGTLTNFKTIRARIDKLVYVENLQEKGELTKYTKKEQSNFKDKLKKFNVRMGGIKHMKELPKAVFVVDLVSDELAVREAKRMGIPVVAIADTNADPKQADIIIPGNDDAVGSIKFIMTYIAANLKK